MLGFTEILVIVAVGIVIFNARRLPEIGSALGRTFGAFRKGIGGKEDERESRDVHEIDSKKKP